MKSAGFRLFGLPVYVNPELDELELRVMGPPPREWFADPMNSTRVGEVSERVAPRRSAPTDDPTRLTERPRGSQASK